MVQHIPRYISHTLKPSPDISHIPWYLLQISLTYPDTFCRYISHTLIPSSAISHILRNCPIHLSLMTWILLLSILVYNWSCHQLILCSTDLVSNWSCLQLILSPTDLVSNWSCLQLILSPTDLVSNWSCLQRILSSTHAGMFKNYNLNTKIVLIHQKIVQLCLV